MKDVLSEPTSKKVEDQNSNNAMMRKEKEACQDLKGTKTCKKLKKKNDGKGCEKSSVKKNCKKTCGLCDDGNSFLCRTHWLPKTICRTRLSLYNWFLSFKTSCKNLLSNFIVQAVKCQLCNKA